jgi:hypothetical protein
VVDANVPISEVLASLATDGKLSMKLERIALQLDAASLDADESDESAGVS